MFFPEHPSVLYTHTPPSSGRWELRSFLLRGTFSVGALWSCSSCFFPLRGLQAQTAVWNLNSKSFFQPDITSQSQHSLDLEYCILAATTQLKKSPKEERFTTHPAEGWHPALAGDPIRHPSYSLQVIASPTSPSLSKTLCLPGSMPTTLPCRKLSPKVTE